MGVIDVAASSAIADWSGFYGSVAGVGATLVGLVFVGVSIQLARQPLDSRSRRLAVMSAVNLLHPMLAALVMLMPVPPLALGVTLLGVAALTLGATLVIVTAETRHPEGQTRQMLVFRYVIPVLAAALLAAGALGLAMEQKWALYAIPAFVLLMFAVGTDNAWDLVLANFGKRSFTEI